MANPTLVINQASKINHGGKIVQVSAMNLEDAQKWLKGETGAVPEGSAAKLRKDIVKYLEANPDTVVTEEAAAPATPKTLTNETAQLAEYEAIVDDPDAGEAEKLAAIGQAGILLQGAENRDEVMDSMLERAGLPTWDPEYAAAATVTGGASFSPLKSNGGEHEVIITLLHDSPRPSLGQKNVTNPLGASSLYHFVKFDSESNQWGSGQPIFEGGSSGQLEMEGFYRIIYPMGGNNIRMKAPQFDDYLETLEEKGSDLLESCIKSKSVMPLCYIAANKTELNPDGTVKEVKGVRVTPGFFAGLLNFSDHISEANDLRGKVVDIESTDLKDLKIKTFGSLSADFSYVNSTGATIKMVPAKVVRVIGGVDTELAAGLVTETTGF